MTYCLRCGIPHSDQPCRRKDTRMDQPKTIAEKLDAANDGKEFGAVIIDMFAALDKARYEECRDTDDE